MKHTLCLITGLFALPLLPLMAAEPSVFPKKNPVFSYEAPAKWKTEIDAENGSTSISSPDGRISMNLAEVPVAASMETFEKMLPDMIKTFDEPVVDQKPKEHTEDGLTGYAASYNAKVEGKPAKCMIALFKGDEKHSVLSCIVVSEPDTLPDEDNEAMGTFMKSWKGAAAKGGESLRPMTTGYDVSPVDGENRHVVGKTKRGERLCLLATQNSDGSTIPKDKLLYTVAHELGGISSLVMVTLILMIMLPLLRA